MKARSKRILDMLIVVSDFLSLNAAFFSTVPGLAAVIAEYAANVLQLSALRQSLADNPAAGATKSSLRTGLEKLVRRHSVRFTSYAAIKKLADLKKQVRFTKSAIRNMTDEELLDKARLLHNKANALLAELAGYNINAAVQTDLETHADEFELSIPKAREEVTSHSGDLASFEALEAETVLILTEVIDEAAEMLSEDDGDLIAKYFKNRKVLDPPSRKTSIKGYVKSSVSNERLKYVSVTYFDGKTRSSAKGNFRFMSLRPGVYTLTFSKPGFISQDVTAVVGSTGETASVVVQLVPIETTG